MGVFQHLADRIMVAYYIRELAHVTTASEASRSADALVRIGVPAVPALLGLLKGSNLESQYAAGVALKKIFMEDQEAASAIFTYFSKALEGGGIDIRRGVADAIGAIAKGNADDCIIFAADLAGMLGDADSTVRSVSENTIQRILYYSEKSESIALLEERLKEGAASLARRRRGRDDAWDAMRLFARCINTAASEKNKFAVIEMEKNGLMLSGERPKPPKKDGGMYREIGGMKRAVRHG